MGKNRGLIKAKNEKNDEFYTQYEDIEAELSHYKEFLKGKVIYLPCDNPYQSQFVAYLIDHFNDFGLKRLIATCYDDAFSQLSLFEDYDESGQVIEKEKQAYKLIIERVRGDPKLESVLELEGNSLTILKENGDFGSQECIEIMKSADVVITNPPFSLFRVLIRLLRNLEKDFILLGASQAITYTECFQLFQNGQLHLGVTPFSSALNFEVPAGNVYEIEIKGKFYKQVPVSWLTSFQVEREIRPLRLTQVYNLHDYPTLDNNEDIINVDKNADIPKDYLGKMAVPITYLAYWDKKRYSLLGKVDKGFVSGNEKFTRFIIQKIRKGI